jgi:hypothetical protein
VRSTGLLLALATLVAAAACTSDIALGPTSGHTSQIADIPPQFFAAYTRENLPGTETVVALNDNGDVVGASASGGVLWHGAAHERTTLPITPTAIAHDGTVAGIVDGHAATWKNGRVTVLDTASSIALAICRCESATVVGSVQVNGITHAAIWAAGARIDAGVPPNSKNAAFTSIANGFVVGNAIVRVLDPRTSDSADFEQPFSWSSAGGWRPLQLQGVAMARVVSLNAHGMAVGSGLQFLSTIVRSVLYDVAAGTGVGSTEGETPFFNGIEPTGINDSQLISANAVAIDANGQPLGSIALGGGLVLPPGALGDLTAGINTAGIIGGQSNALPVLWIPNT